MVFSRQKFNSFSLVKRSPILHQTTIFCINYGQWRKQSDNSTKVQQVEFAKNNKRLVCGKQTADINNGLHNNNHISYTLYTSWKPVPNKTHTHTHTHVLLKKAMKGNQKEKEKNLIQKRKSSRKYKSA